MVVVLRADAEYLAGSEETVVFSGSIHLDAESEGAAGVMSTSDIMHSGTNAGQFADLVSVTVTFPN